MKFVPRLSLFIITVLFLTGIISTILVLNQNRLALLFFNNTTANSWNQQQIYQRIDLTKSWFLHNIDQKKKILEYEYDPDTDQYSDDNNHVRQLATLWSMTETNKLLGADQELDSLIFNTINYYLYYTECDQNSCYLKINNKAKLAYNAFLLLALQNTPDYPNSANWQGKLGRAILKQQQNNGSYNTYFDSDKNSGTDYYPGEAMLALIKYYRLTDEPAYLQSVNSAFYYYRDYWRKNKNSPFIPWHSQADYLLYLETKDPAVADFVFEISDWLIANRQVLNSANPQYIGGFPKPTPKITTAVDLEGLLDAYQLAKLVNDQEHIAKYQKSVDLGINFLLKLQYTPDLDLQPINPGRAYGGFRQSLTNNDQRIDYSQHAVMALIKAYNYNSLE